jgi:hypothetical protein
VNIDPLQDVPQSWDVRAAILRMRNGAVPLYKAIFRGYGYGSVEFDIPGYAVLYRYSESGFVLKDLSDKARRIEVDLSALETGSMHYRLMGKPRSGLVGRRSTLTLAGHEEVRWIRESVVNHAPK